MCAKAIRDGVIDAVIDHENGWIRSQELLDVYATDEPQQVTPFGWFGWLHMEMKDDRGTLFEPYPLLVKCCGVTAALTDVMSVADLFTHLLERRWFGDVVWSGNAIDVVRESFVQRWSPLKRGSSTSSVHGD